MYTFLSFLGISDNSHTLVRPLVLSPYYSRSCIHMQRSRSIDESFDETSAIDDLCIYLKKQCLNVFGEEHSQLYDSKKAKAGTKIKPAPSDVALFKGEITYPRRTRPTAVANPTIARKLLLGKVSCHN